MRTLTAEPPVATQPHQTAVQRALHACAGLRRHGWVLLPWLLLLGTGLWAVDFGKHWDERFARFESIRKMVESGIMLQGHGLPLRYLYPGVNLILTIVGFTPELAAYALRGEFTREALAAAILPVVDSHDALLRVRAIHTVVASLSVLWLYGLAIRLGRPVGEALVAAGFLACSWEVAYHARWIAPDAIMMQFALLTLFLCAQANGGDGTRGLAWLYGASFAAGLTIATKYPGGVVLLPVLAVTGRALMTRRACWWEYVLHGIGLVGLAGFVVILTTPGIVLHPFQFLSDMHFAKTTYANGWFGYTVAGRVEHARGLLLYFSNVLFSPWPALASVFWTLCLIGLVRSLIERRFFEICLIVFAALYFFYFTGQKAMIVRNILVIVPILALWGARGAAWVWEVLPGRGARGAAIVALMAAFAANAMFLVHAAHETVHRTDEARRVRQFVAYAGGPSAPPCFVSKQLAAQIRKLGGTWPTALTTDPSAQVVRVAFLYSESVARRAKQWPHNWHDMFEAWFGAQEVNPNYYATFVGNERIFVTPRDHLDRMPLRLVELAR